MICTVGKTCTDIVSFVTQFPCEDTDQRCTKQSWERGGNASNNATVLAALGAPAEFLGPLAKDHLLEFLTDDMKSYGIKFDNCPVYETLKSPVSVVLNSEKTGTRTIVHSIGTIPELGLDDFRKLNLDKYSWIHFEGRNELAAVEMIQLISEYNDKNPSSLPEDATNNEALLPNYKMKKIPISVEVEKVRESLSVLVPVADLVFVGKDFAMMKGATTFTEAIKIISQSAQSGAIVICAWGDQGAAFATVGEEPLQVKTVPAFPPEKIIDSLGAGDTFFAAVIFGLSSGLDVETTVRFACRLASSKLCQYGFKKVGDAARQMPEYKKIIEMKKCMPIL